MKERILIIDDDRQYADSLAFSLKKDFEVSIAVNKLEATENLSYKVDAVLLDINFSGELSSGDTSGFTILEEIRERFVLLPVIMLSGYETPGIIIDSFRKGASDYVIKGKVDINELKSIIRSHLEKNRRIQATVKGGEDIRFVGSSQKTKKLKEEIAKIAPYDTTVLVTGETGVGKELAARYIHHLSKRRIRPFIPVSIAALPVNLIESELFGHKKGAFTDARSDRKGYFEVANHGTLFLDEIGEMPLDVQVKLLRFLEDKRVYQLGSTNGIQIDVRLICASNKNLEEEVKKGTFRQDLYFRIKVYELAIPPLRERKEDIQELTNSFIFDFSEKNGSRIKKIDNKAMEVLLKHTWRGNVRELKNVIESAVLKADMDKLDTIIVTHLPFELQRTASKETVAVPDFNKKILVEREMNRLFVDFAEKALEDTMGNKKEAASLLGLKDDETLRYRIKIIFKKYPHLLEDKPWIQKLYGYIK